ncbi:TPA: hypothetical protein ACJEU7_002190 [Acinetobacter baumannii]|uniref:hypothetical protein n=1 Tax=Acinetobacter baumannii TaxID=470 RepID=UPI00224F4A18|nr:hypothetical protein [Acinetobacter baumannii]MCX3035221.1 hypothetical protein [Acinetobacter baumannii]
MKQHIKTVIDYLLRNIDFSFSNSFIRITLAFIVIFFGLISLTSYSRFYLKGAEIRQVEMQFERKDKRVMTKIMSGCKIDLRDAEQVRHCLKEGKKEMIGDLRSERRMALLKLFFFMVIFASLVGALLWLSFQQKLMIANNQENEN